MIMHLSLGLIAILITAPANACDLHRNPSAAETAEDQESSATVKDEATKSPAADKKISPQKKKKSAPAKPSTAT
jgi:hypothetical protein